MSLPMLDEIEGADAPQDRTGAQTRPGRAGSVPRWTRVLVRSIFDLLLVVWLAATIAFLALQLIPGNPLDVLLSGVQDATPEMRAEIAAHYGLDQPTIVQYFNYLFGVLQGDLGTSYHRGSPVTQVLFSELGATVELTVAAMLVAVAASIALALLTSGQRPGVRLIAQGLEIVAVSVPSFWLGIVLMTIFSFGLRWVPAFSGDSPAGLILPVITLAVPLVGVITQILRERIEHQLHEPFVTTIRARGVSESRLRSGHLLRHASVPALTLSSIIFGSLLTGTVVIETLFARPGIGRVIVMALQDRDVPVVLGFVIFAALIFIIINTIVDLVLPLIDPRLKESR